MKKTPCKGCQAPIVWAINTQSGKKVPIDMDVRGKSEGLKLKGSLYYLSPSGMKCLPIEGADAIATIIREIECDHVQIVVRGNPQFFEAPVNRIGMSHYKTCPNADQFNRSAADKERQ